jgi:hypothetical protein
MDGDHFAMKDVLTQLFNLLALETFVAVIDAFSLSQPNISILLSGVCRVDVFDKAFLRDTITAKKR